MRVLVIGSGGREHALVWKLKQSPRVTEVYAAPGNPGIAALADCVPIAPDEVQALADFATELKIDLTVVGPELPLSLGVVDDFQSRGLLVFGPRQAAAQLESSKLFAKEFMLRHGIPTARSEVANDADEARAFGRKLGFPVVLKADGLAAGKGVIIATDKKELDAAITVFFDERRFGTSGDTVLVEEFLEGEEVSFMGLSDGRRILPMATAKDYKRLGDGDVGPNTGGMGAHTPAGVIGGTSVAAILEQVMMPTVGGMAEEDTPFVGVLYAGLMLTADGPKVLEFNTRFGDPECQPLLMRLESDLAEILEAGAQGDFGSLGIEFARQAASSVVLASRGYPEKPVSGEVIEGLEAAAAHEGVQVFHAGTREENGKVVSSGGRVLNVCATGFDLRDALRNAYQAATEIKWPSKILRTDIGRRVIEHHHAINQTGDVNKDALRDALKKKA